MTTTPTPTHTVTITVDDKLVRHAPKRIAAIKARERNLGDTGLMDLALWEALAEAAPELFEVDDEVQRVIDGEVDGEVWTIVGLHAARGVTVATVYNDDKGWVVVPVEELTRLGDS